MRLSRGNDINISLRNGTQTGKYAIPPLSWSQQTGPQSRLKTRPPYLQRAVEDGPLRGIISARPELLIGLITRLRSLDCAWRRDKSTDGRCFRRTKMNGSGGMRRRHIQLRSGRDVYKSPSWLWHHPPISSKCSILCYMCLSLQAIWHLAGILLVS